ncbi:hypothetical protein AMATHDRAFT_7660 [Amanita thiersii Skay4041]|uniref:F-box domain-containing protein n=1 Tax=Amanita thiersii Skay4041 TaxID=703135 RepID=A0A2A9NFY9_9AGAR|nr:hypothetical protein AMATHDRAFT_7660 [Amanita thiersii Skay4041]
MQRFPLELLDAVIGCLEGDICALRSCALVCQSWCYPSRTRIFRQITFDFSDFDPYRTLSSLKLLHGCLNRNSYIQHYVRNIVICNLQWPIAAVTRRGESALRVVANILTLFRGVRELTLSNTNWWCLTDVLQQSICETIFPSCTDLLLEDFMTFKIIDISRLLSFTNDLSSLKLKNISSLDVTFSTSIQLDPNEYEGRKRQLRSMDSLSISANSLLSMKYIQTLYDFKNLDSMSLGCVGDSNMALVEEMLRKTKRLRHLELRLDPPSASLQDFTLSLNNFPNIRSLETNSTGLAVRMFRGTTYNHPIRSAIIHSERVDELMLDHLKLLDTCCVQPAFTSMNLIELRLVDEGVEQADLKRASECCPYLNRKEVIKIHVPQGLPKGSGKRLTRLNMVRNKWREKRASLDSIDFNR